MVQKGKREHAIVSRQRNEQCNGLLGQWPWAVGLKNVPHGNLTERLVRAQGCRTYSADPKKITVTLPQMTVTSPIEEQD